MTTTLSSLAQLVDGRLVGNESLEIRGAATIRDAKWGEITLVDRPQLLDELANSQAVAAVVAENAISDQLPCIVVKNVHEAFTIIVAHLRPVTQRARIGVSPAAHIAPSAVIAEDVDIHPGAVVGEDVHIGAGTTIHSGVNIMPDCRIGSDAVIYPNVVVYGQTQVGNRVIIHANAVIGAFGFGYSTVEGRHQLSAQLGNVIIQNDAEIGAGTTVDRGTYGPTVIGEGTKLDNLVQIGHNCRIGRHNLLCAQVGVAGSSSTGDYVVLAGQVGVCDHVHVGDMARLGAKSGVASDIPPGGSYLGIPATLERDHKQQWASLVRLPALRKAFKSLKKQVDGIEESPSQQDAA
jgi:UDP-3-O-[3-hydroxymyristoyl] glucosamine N-acyltransferase